MLVPGVGAKRNRQERAVLGSVWAGYLPGGYVKSLCFVLVLAALGWAVPPPFDGPYPVLCAGVPIDVGRYGVPAMGDLTGDGRKDLVVGQYDSGYVRCYPNVGTDASPVFDSVFFVEASGSVIKLPYS